MKILFEIFKIIIFITLGSYGISVICMIGWCDSGFMGYPDCWRSELAKKISYILCLITIIGIFVCFILILIFAFIGD